MRSVSYVIIAICLVWGYSAQADDKQPKQSAGMDWIPNPVGSVVYESRFDKQDMSNWSVEGDHHLQIRKARKKTPAFLGEFLNDKVRLKLTKLPAHKFLLLECDLLILKTWGCSEVGDDKDGPDLFTARLVNGPTLLHASFSAFQRFPQSYPDAFPVVRHPGLTGATRPGLSGLPKFKENVGDTSALYRLRLVTSHSAADATLEFEGQLKETIAENQTTDNESWALANVRIAVSETPLAKVDEKRFQTLWQTLAGNDALAARDAGWELAAAGEAILPLIEKSAKETPPSAREIEQLITQLDADDYKVREEATAKLREMGKAAIPAMRKALEGNVSLEVKNRLGNILSHPKSGDRQVAIARQRQVLEQIGTTQAKELLKQLPPLPEFKPLDPPDHPDEDPALTPFRAIDL